LPTIEDISLATEEEEEAKCCVGTRRKLPEAAEGARDCLRNFASELTDSRLALGLFPLSLLSSSSQSPNILGPTEVAAAVIAAAQEAISIVGAPITDVLCN
jgi:hypothetical protein